ncbi:hypothetical protein GALMADRAFT_223814 [Galerina marginata CBS 339.88]|uniref:Uncharacterized protein n=1 Tax=Galerina marginata (strain CBS 339.88) TaxID=685588 RepID=A0A067T5Q8_GALM3|nr:hypothetical protein GALMADRAFT_223814 [Galerina marginata CBS 339.88]
MPAHSPPTTNTTTTITRRPRMVYPQPPLLSTTTTTRPRSGYPLLSTPLACPAPSGVEKQQQPVCCTLQ